MNDEGGSNDQSPLSLVEALWRFRGMAAMIVGAFVALGAIVGTYFAPPATATATIALKTPQSTSVLAPGISGDASLSRYTSQRARFVTSDAVLGEVADVLGRGNVTRLRGQVSASPSATSNTISIRVEGGSAEDAVGVAEAVVTAYGTETEAQVTALTTAALDALEASRVQAEESLQPGASAELRESVATTLGQLRSEANQLERSRALYGDGIEFVVAPRMEAVATAGLPLREMALGLLLGLAAAATACWIRADRTRGINSALDAQPLLDAPLLGELHSSSDSSLPYSIDLGSLPSHDYRLVWSALLRRSPSGVILINSTNEEARAMAALNLAIAAVREDLSVLLVDADLENGIVSRALLGIPLDGTGVWELFTEGGPYAKRAIAVNLGGVRELFVLPAGRGVEPELNTLTKAVDEYVAEWRADFDVVVIDAQPITSVQVASVLSGAVDGTLVVVCDGDDERELEELRRWVGLQGTPVIGYVYVPAGDWLGQRRPERHVVR